MCGKNPRRSPDDFNRDPINSRIIHAIMKNLFDSPIVLTAEQAISYIDALREHYEVEWPADFLDNSGIAFWYDPEDNLYYEPMVGRIIQNRHNTMKIFAIIQQNN